MNDKPIRVQLHRKKGWRLPQNTVSVARPTKWGNPFRFHGLTNEGREEARLESVKQFEAMWMKHDAETIRKLIAPLRGKNLACWCPLSSKCHADVLLRIANP
jgi:hypothetical protein